MIKSGDRIPSVPIKLVEAGGTIDADAAEVLGSGRIVLFTVPGAFTPSCSTNHLPGYLAVADKIKAMGIDRIICAAVNDHHVMRAWAEQSGALGAIDFIADGNADLARALGLENDMLESGMGTRFVRSAIILADGRATEVFAEPKRGQVTASGAPAILAFLGAGK